jgi:hypothetical protein
MVVALGAVDLDAAVGFQSREQGVEPVLLNRLPVVNCTKMGLHIMLGSTRGGAEEDTRQLLPKITPITVVGINYAMPGSAQQTF